MFGMISDKFLKDWLDFFLSHSFQEVLCYRSYSLELVTVVMSTVRGQGILST